jgi:hypothetical protein
MSLSGAIASARKPLIEQPEAEPAAKVDVRAMLATWAGRAGVAILSGLGLAGSIAVLGGAIAWTRFDAAGLPATQAVDAVPRHELIVIGAAALVPFALLGLGLVVLLFVLDPGGTVSAGTLVGLAAAGVAAFVYVGTTDLESGATTALYVLIALLVLFVLSVSHVTGSRFAWFGAALFAAVIVFGGVVSYLIQRDNAKLQPMVVLRGKEIRGLMGVYVSATPEHLYLGRLPRGGNVAGLVVLPRKADTLFAIGRSIPVGRIGKADALLLRRLRTERAVLPKSKKPKAAKKPNVAR